MSLPGKESAFPPGTADVALVVARQTQRTSSGLVTSTNLTAPDWLIDWSFVSISIPQPQTKQIAAEISIYSLIVICCRRCNQQPDQTLTPSVY